MSIYVNKPKQNCPPIISKEEREANLQKEWEDKMPCNGCALTGICKFYNSIKRLDFNKEIFSIEISCNKKLMKENEKPILTEEEEIKLAEVLDDNGMPYVVNAPSRW